MDTTLTDLTLIELASLIRRKKVSPVDVVTTFINRIDQLEPTLNCFITVTADNALRQARQAEKDISNGNYKGPLHGIPFALKDLYYTKDITTTAGSKLLKDFTPDHNAAVTQHLLDAGAVLLGKTNMDEFAAGGSTENSQYGVTHNPWNTEAIPGGSSGGSAAAVAASLCTFAMGTDTGGSVRIPAAYCGVVGFQPTYGLVSRYGVIPEAWTLDNCGPLAHTVGDCAAIMEVIAGYDKRDLSSVDSQRINFTNNHSNIQQKIAKKIGSYTKPRTLKGLRIGVPRKQAFSIIDPEVAEATEDAIKVFQQLGACIHEVSYPNPEQLWDVVIVIMFSEAASYHQKWLRERRNEYGPAARTYFTAGLLHSATEYIQAQRIRTVFVRTIREALDQVDLVLMPTIPIPAPRIGQKEVTLNDVPYPSLLLTARLTGYANIAGVPTISLPSGFSSTGLPLSITLQGQPYTDPFVLRIAEHFQKTTEWHKKRPVIASR